MQDRLDKVSIVLVEPQNPGNVGMVCRAMANMGLSDLRIVKGCRLDHPEALKFAVSAKDMLFSAQRFETLAEAIADTAVSVATTRRHGKYRREILPAADAAEAAMAYLEQGRAAFVFGREDSGLTTEEVSLCNRQATIPTGSDYGSLNLSQAVVIFCYEILKALGGTVEAPPRVPAPSADMEACFAQMEEVFLRIGFLNPQNPDHLMRSLRRIFQRSEPDEREVAILRGMLTQIDWAADSFDGKKKR